MDAGGEQHLNPRDPCEEETASRQHHHPVGGRRPGDHTGPPHHQPLRRTPHNDSGLRRTLDASKKSRPKEKQTGNQVAEQKGGK